MKHSQAVYSTKHAVHSIYGGKKTNSSVILNKICLQKVMTTIMGWMEFEKSITTIKKAGCMDDTSNEHTMI